MRIFTVDEVAQRERLTPNAVRRRLRENAYPGAYRDGKRWCIPETALRETLLDLPSPTQPARRVVAVVNQKGGVGKTITSINLACGLRRLGRRVLLVDLDGQGNATSGLGVIRDTLELSIANVLSERPVALESVVLPLEDDSSSYLVPSNIRLQRVERDMIGEPFSHARLSLALSKFGPAVDFAIIDCPPSLGALFVNGTYAATDVLVPIAADYFSLLGVKDLLDVLRDMRERGGHDPRVHALLTHYDARTNIGQQTMAAVRSHFGTQMCETVVRTNSKLAEATAVGQSIIAYAPASRGSEDYRRLAKEVAAWPVEE
jgi:chromosome partitioning protein